MSLTGPLTSSLTSSLTSPLTGEAGTGGGGFSLADVAIVWFNPYDNSTVTGSPITSVTDGGSDGGSWAPWAGADPQTGPNQVTQGAAYAAYFDGTADHTIERALPTTTLVDVFMIIQKLAGGVAAVDLLNDDGGSRHIRWNSGATSAIGSNAGTPTVYVDDSTVANQQAFYNALNDAAYHRVRIANLDLSTWSKLRLNADNLWMEGRVATLLAVSPSDASDNLDDINTTLTSMIAALEA